MLADEGLVRYALADGQRVLRVPEALFLQVGHEILYGQIPDRGVRVLVRGDDGGWSREVRSHQQIGHRARQGQHQKDQKSDGQLFHWSASFPVRPCFSR